jgi:hypothetical protein
VAQEPEGSSLHSQHPDTGPYPEPAEYIPIFRCLGCAKQSVLIRGCVKCFVTNIEFYGGGGVSPPPNPQAGGSPTVGCPRLLIQYIRSYPPNLEPVSSVRNPRTRHTVVTVDPLNMAFLSYWPVVQHWVFREPAPYLFHIVH